MCPCVRTRASTPARANPHAPTSGTRPHPPRPHPHDLSPAFHLAFPSPGSHTRPLPLPHAAQPGRRRPDAARNLAGGDRIRRRRRGGCRIRRDRGRGGGIHQLGGRIHRRRGRRGCIHLVPRRIHLAPRRDPPRRRDSSVAWPSGRHLAALVIGPFTRSLLPSHATAARPPQPLRQLPQVWAWNLRSLRGQCRRAARDWSTNGDSAPPTASASGSAVVVSSPPVVPHRLSPAVTCPSALPTSPVRRLHAAAASLTPPCPGPDVQVSDATRSPAQPQAVTSSSPNAPARLLLASFPPESYIWLPQLMDGYPLLCASEGFSASALILFMLAC